jgi:hypothetical protein
MTIPERVHRFLIDRRPDGFCDDCTCRELRLSRRQEVAPVTKSFGLTAEFIRHLGSCGSCAHPRNKLVIHAI